MQINLNIETTISSALEASLSTDKLRAAIEKHVGDTVSKVVQDALSPYSDFGKTVKEAVKSMLPHELSLDGAATWNHYMASAISERVAAYNDERFRQAMAPMLDQLLAQPPAELKLSDLVGKAIKMWADHHRRDGAWQPTVIVEQSTGVASGFWHIYLDPQSDCSKYSCSVRLDVTDKGEVYSLRVDERDVKGQRFAGPFYNFDAYLFQLYTGGTRLIIDRKDFSDESYPDSDD